MSRPKKTKKPNGDGYLEQNKSGNWRGRFYITDPLTNKRIRKSTKTYKTRKEAQIELNEILKDINSYMNINNNITLSEWFEIWLNTYKINSKSIKPNTIASYKFLVREYINNTDLPIVLGNLKMAEIKPIQIQKLYNYLLNEKINRKNDEKGLSPKTIKNLHGLLSCLFKKAQAEGLINNNIFSMGRIELPKQIKNKPHAFTSEEIKKFIKATNNKENIIFQFALYTGLRFGELAGLTWDCVDFKNKKIEINKQLVRKKEKGGQWYFSTTKNNKYRTINLIDEAVILLQKQSIKQKEDKLKAGQLWQYETEKYAEHFEKDKKNFYDLVFTDEYGKRTGYNELTRRYEKILKNENIANHSFHDLRHSCVSLLLLAGVNLASISQQLGHYSVDFTIKTYGFFDEELKIQNTNKLSNYLRENII